MTESERLNSKPENRKIALLISVACVLQISESMIPHPILGLRMGLANMVTLVALVMLGFRSSMEIAIIRTVLSSIIMGTFMSPTFILSFAGAVVSTMVMGFLMWYSRTYHGFGHSIIGISIIGALIHNMVQLYLAYLILIRHSGIFIFLPWLCLGSIAMGWITGTVAGSVCQILEKYKKDKIINDSIQKEYTQVKSYHYCYGSSFLHRLSPEFKISVMIFLSLFVLMVDDFRIFLGLFIFLIIITVASKTSPVYIFKKVYGLAMMIILAFLLPLFFNKGTNVIFKISQFAVTYEGVITGSIISLRVILLIICSAILVRTTSPNELTIGLSKILIPLRYIGISEKRTAYILLLSWNALPAVWNTVRNEIKNSNLSKLKKIQNMLPLLTGLIASLYLETEREDIFLESNCIDKQNK